MAAVGKKLHHTVPRFYLRAWAKADRLYCLRRDKIFRTNIRNIGAENHFYRLREMTKEDLDLVRELMIEHSPERLKPFHEQLLSDFALPPRLKSQLEAIGTATPESMAEVDQVIAELNENLHTSIEDTFQPFLAEMRSGSSNFQAESLQSPLFYRSLATQFSRTNMVNRASQFFGPERMPAFRRIMNVLVHIIATNLGFSLYADRSTRTVTFLDNSSDVPFVTGDQPIINISSNPKERVAPEKFDLYYPLSPIRAVLFLEPGSPHLPTCTSVTGMSASVYNMHVAAHSHAELFSDSEEELVKIRAQLSSFLSCL